jgi:hypothetical protein
VFYADHEEFRKCHVENPIAKFFGECTDLKIKLDRCFGAEVRFFSFYFIFLFKYFKDRCFDLVFIIINCVPTESCEEKSQL